MRILLIAILFVFFVGGVCYGQPDPPGGGGNPTPISGIEWLLLAGGVLGGKKAIQSFRNRKQEN